MSTDTDTDTEALARAMHEAFEEELWPNSTPTPWDVLEPGWQTSWVRMVERAVMPRLDALRCEVGNLMFALRDLSEKVLLGPTREEKERNAAHALLDRLGVARTYPSPDGAPHVLSLAERIANLVAVVGREAQAALRLEGGRALVHETTLRRLTAEIVCEALAEKWRAAVAEVERLTAVLSDDATLHANCLHPCSAIVDERDAWRDVGAVLNTADPAIALTTVRALVVRAGRNPGPGTSLVSGEVEL